MGMVQKKLRGARLSVIVAKSETAIGLSHRRSVSRELHIYRQFLVFMVAWNLFAILANAVSWLIIHPRDYRWYQRSHSSLKQDDY